jgi:TRAP-type C4-dicarboxylate transport system permease small subunit
MVSPNPKGSGAEGAKGPRFGWQASVLHEGVLIALLGTLILLGGLQVLLRYVFSSPLVWPEEFASLLLLWLTFVGAAFADRRRSHVAVTILLDLCPKSVGHWLRATWLVLTGAFLLLVAWQGWLLVWMHRDVENPALGYSVAFGEAALPVGAAVAFAITVRRLGKLLGSSGEVDPP